MNFLKRKKEKQMEQSLDKLVSKALRKMGFKPLEPNHINANGVDIFAVKNNRAFSIEIKKARYPKKGIAVQVDPVLKNRRNDDLIAIVLPSGYVLVEPMKQHLKLCGPKGYRPLTPLC